ncbi:MAG: type II secretion system F family protein, partial [Acidobacteriota bacterium]
GAQLPLPTRVTIAISTFLGRWMPVILLGLGVGAFSMARYHKTHAGRRHMDRLVLKIPVMGKLLRKIAVARFCRTLGTMVSSGVPILEGLDVTAKTSGNAIVEDAIITTRKAVEEGQTLATPLGESDVFPSMVVQMISVGEQTGALDAMLAKIADFYEDEVDEAVANLLALLEPVMIVFLGTIIGGIVISMYMPLFSLINKIG